MKTNYQFLLSALACVALAFSALADGGDAGNNHGGAISQGSQTAAPAGQSDFHTDLFTGRFGYSVPFEVAPARHGSAPSIQLQYNSGNGNSWCGVGWDLDLGYIERQTKHGVPVLWSGGNWQRSYDDSKGFLFSLNKKASDLVNIGGNDYRAEIQSDFLKFQLTSSNTWVVIDKSGNQYYFGSTSGSRMVNTNSGWSGSSGTFRWGLDTIVTATGDKSTLSYTNIGNLLYPQIYTYNGHTASSTLSTNIVQFILTTTNRTDTTVSLKSGFQVYQQRLLNAIVHKAGAQMVWSNRLSYATSSSTIRSLLTSVTHYGTDQSSSLPPITFNYSQQSLTFQSPVHWTNLFFVNTNGLLTTNGGYFGLTSTLTELADMDGDGLPDRVTAAYPNAPIYTNFWIQHNNGLGFSATNVWPISHQVYQGYDNVTNRGWYLINSGHCRVLDINGDGRSDLVFDPFESYFNNPSSATYTNYTRHAVQLNNSTNFNSLSSWMGVNDQYNGVTNQTFLNRAIEQMGGSGDSYLIMLDMNGDGLPDRVMRPPGQVNSGSQIYYTNYLVQFNTGNGYTSVNSFGPYYSQTLSNYADWNGLVGNQGAAGISGGTPVSMRLLDINGDGLPDRVMLVRDTNSLNGAATPQYQTSLVVELNNGYGFERQMNWTNVISFYNVSITNGPAYCTIPGIEDLGDNYQVAYRDLNGDGLPDRIIACQCTPSVNPYNKWLVQLNTGLGFTTSFINWPTDSQGITDDTAPCGIMTSSAMLLDMNGDGLPDRVEVSKDNTNYLAVELNSGPFPDLLITASNGIGGYVQPTYKPANQWDNRENTNSATSRYLLPFPFYTVVSTVSGDGIYSGVTNKYSYTGGYWSPLRRQFHGFAQAIVVDPLGTTNVHWYHQAGGRDNSAFGEYDDSTNAFGKVGMEYRTDTIGSDGNLYRLVLNKIEETNLSGGQHFAYLATNIDIEYPGSTNSYRATAKKSQFNATTGNLTNILNYGEVTGVTVSNQSFTDATANDNIYQITAYAGLSNTNILDKPSSLILSSDSAGSSILRQSLYSHDGDTGNLLEQRDLICPGSYRTNSYLYDGYNNQQYLTSAAGIVTQISYDSASQTFPATTIVGNSTFTTTTSYDRRSGSLSGSIDPAGLVTTNYFDAFLRLTERDVSATSNGTPNVWLEKYVYTQGTVNGAPTNSILTKKSDGVDLSNGHQMIRYSDGMGRVIQNREQSETSGTYRVINTVYDKRGNVQFVSLPYFSSSGTSFTKAATGLGSLRIYDSVGRVTNLISSVTGSFNSSGVLTNSSPTGGDNGSPIGANIIAYFYSGDVWTIAVTNEAGKSHRYVLDAYGRTNQVIEVTAGGNFTTTYSYNLVGDLTNITDNAGNKIQYAYNNLGELVAMADPDLGVWQYQRDYAGRVRSQIDGNGQTITNTYSGDPLGRLVSRQIYDLRRNFAYGATNIWDASDDPNFKVAPGQIYKTIDSEGYEKNGYDVRGRKNKTARYLSKNGNTYTSQFTFDDLDRVTSIIYPSSGPTITNIYDSGANLWKVQQPGATVYYTATGFNAIGQITGITYGNSRTATYGYYSNSKRLQSVTTSGSLQSLGYSYDTNGNIISISDSIYSGAASAAISGVNYDDLDRLTSLTRNGTTYNFGFDSIGNTITNSENGSAAYTYGTRLPHAVKSANGQSYAYDLCGNMVVRGKQSLVYNPESRLIAVVSSNQVTTFGYAADGARLWKKGPGTNTLQVWIGGVYEEKDGKTLFHVSAADRIVCTFDAGHTLTNYYHPDHLHSAEVLSDGTGNSYQHYEYGTWGQSRYTSSTSAFPVSRRYTSQILDEETGLYYYGARYYDAELGRFTQPDTIIPNIFDPQAYDRYSYARNNPLKYVDSSGHAPLLFDKQAWGQWLHDFFIGDTGAHKVDPNSLAALKGDMGVGVTALKDENGNIVSPGQVTAQIGMAVVKAPIDTALMLGGEGEAKGAYQVADKLLRAKKLEGAAKLSEAAARGRASEKRVLEELGQAKNTEKVLGKEGASIPDFQSSTKMGEIKDTKRVTDSRQLRIQKEAAEQSGKAHEIHTGVNTAVSENAAKGTTVVRRPDLGPPTSSP